MEKAGEAMKQIHGKLTPEKVDETMYVLYAAVPPDLVVGKQALTIHTGPNSRIRLHLARRLWEL